MRVSSMEKLDIEAAARADMALMTHFIVLQWV
jgi:hypothetical protein